MALEGIRAQPDSGMALNRNEPVEVKFVAAAPKSMPQTYANTHPNNKINRRPCVRVCG